MPETLSKLRPDRDLQCYFERPSAVAALSETSESGFTVSGCWRQQFDWAVVEWNLDNVFEHPLLRNLPDGDLSGIVLSYEEERTNCVAMDSTWYPTVDWPYLRVWAEKFDPTEQRFIEHLYKVPLRPRATAVGGQYRSATAEFELSGSCTAGDYIELAWPTGHFNYQIAANDTPASAAAALAQIIGNTTDVAASASGNRITLTYSEGAGANANRVGVYGTVHGSMTESWLPAATTFSGGESPGRWRVVLDFSSMRDINDELAPTDRVRKLRWTWAADLQSESYVRSEFYVKVSNWSVSGTGTGYKVAGPGSRRIEDDAPEISYTGSWIESRGNYSGGSIRYIAGQGSVRCTYRAAGAHTLYLGTRRTATTGNVTVSVDGVPRVHRLQLAGEDVLVRLAIAEPLAGAEHTVAISHESDGSQFWFDFLELAAPCGSLPSIPTVEHTTLATDWDTDHSIAIAPERTAWLIRRLGFTGRANHYVGALWFYELARPGSAYGKTAIEFSGVPEWSHITRLWLGPTPIEHLNLIGDTAESIAKALEFQINEGSTGVWARAEGGVLTITARAMGAAGNAIAVAVETNSTTFTATAAGPRLAGGADGQWRTDLSASPRINRAVRDWSRSFYRALQLHGIDVTAAFSMELQHGDDTPAAGVAQRYPDGTAAWLNTPALQTNFSPASTAFWRQVYAEMADVMAEAGLQPYLQFGEVQWWYFPNASGMPFYDEYTRASFQSRYGRPMAIITDENVSPNGYAEEVEHLRSLIGQFTDWVIAYVRTSHPDARFEVLYPADVNAPALNRGVNLPTKNWSPETMDCFKTENFTYTGNRNLDQARGSIVLPMELGFAPGKSSHLVGIGEYATPWRREHQLARGEGVESVVLFALDQYCLIGYGSPLAGEMRRAVFLGS